MPNRRRCLFADPHRRAYPQRTGAGDERLRTVSRPADSGRVRLPTRPWSVRLGARAVGRGDPSCVLGGRDPTLEPVPGSRRTSRREHAERGLRLTPARRQPASDASDVGPLDHRRVRAGCCRGVPVRTHPRPRGGSGGGLQRRFLSQRLVLPVQQQPLQPLVRLSPAALSPRGTRAALAALVARVRTGCRHSRKHLHRDARSVLLRDRRGLGVCRGPARTGATDDGDAFLHRPTRWRGPTGRHTRRSAPALVPAVRVAVVQRSQAGVRTGLGRGSGVGRPPLDRSMVCRRTSGPAKLVRCRSRNVGPRRSVGTPRDEAASCLAVLRDRRHPPRQELRLRRARVGRPRAGCKARGLSGIRAACRLVRVCSAGGNRRSSALESRPSTSPLRHPRRVRLDRAARGPERERPVAGDRRGAPDGLASWCCSSPSSRSRPSYSPPGSADAGQRSSSPASSSPSSRCSCRSMATRSEPTRT